MPLEAAARNPVTDVADRVAKSHQRDRTGDDPEDDHGQERTRVGESAVDLRKGGS